MAPQDKQERRLARQRGAGPRELKNAAFNFSFGGAPALPPPPSSRKTPQPRKQSPQKTPAPRPSTGKRKRITPTPVGPSSARPAKVTSTPTAVLPSDEIDELSPDAPPPAIDESELPQLRRVSIPILPLNRESPRPPPSPDRRPPREERGRSRTRKSIVSVSYSQSRSRLNALNEEDEEEVEELDATTGAEQTVETESTTETTHATPSTRRPSSRNASTTRRVSGATGTFDGGTSAFLKNQAAQSTRREVYVADQESDDELTPGPMKVVRRRQEDIEVLPDADDDASEDEDELSPQQDPTLDESIASVRTPLADRSVNAVKSRPQQGKRPVADDDDDDDELEPEAEPNRKKQKTTATTKPTSTRPPKKTYGGPTIPITIYKRTALPSDDPLGIDPAPQPSLHASDILSQITTEVINAYISSVPENSRRSTGSKATSKKTLRYQMQALQQFRDNLADSLRGITFARVAEGRFGAEVRRERKKVREGREELMGRRREREAAEVEIDRVRRQHLRAEAEYEKQRSLVEDIEGIERAVKAGRENAGSADARASSSVVVDAGIVRERLGVLERVREFNKSLARTAEAL